MGWRTGGAQRFYIYKEGYESKSGQTLKVAEENVVTLRKGRKSAGLGGGRRDRNRSRSFASASGASIMLIPKATGFHQFSRHEGIRQSQWHVHAGG